MEKKFMRKLAFLTVFTLVCGLFYESAVFAKKKLPYTIWEENVSDGFSLIVNKKNKFGIIDKKGKMIIKPVYDEIQIGSDYGLGFESSEAGAVLGFVVRKGERSGLLNRKGKLVYPLKKMFVGERRSENLNGAMEFDFLVDEPPTKKGKELYQKYKKQIPPFSLLIPSQRRWELSMRTGKSVYRLQD